uniref:Uncharacterized protein n=1 Tax=Sphaerodactylus townsendi TaxID=933632 RepID=A0ACB8GDX7_9SAUR
MAVNTRQELPSSSSSLAAKAAAAAVLLGSGSHCSSLPTCLSPDQRWAAVVQRRRCGSRAGCGLGPEMFKNLNKNKLTVKGMDAVTGLPAVLSGNQATE